MSSARIFVTAVLLMSTLISACEGKGKPVGGAAIEQEGKAGEGKSPQEQIDEGNEKFNQAWEVIGELESDYQISINVLGFGRRRGGARLEPSASNYNWRRLSRERRLTVKQKLAEFVTLAARILEIDTKKGVFITDEDKTKVQATLQTVMAYQKSLEKYEVLMGESFEPKPEYSNEPPYKREYDANKLDRAPKKSV